MKILFIGHENELNGASKSLLNVISVLKDKHKIYVLTSYNNGSFINELKNNNISFVYFPFYRFRIVKGSTLGWIKKKFIWYFFENIVNEISAIRIARWARSKNIDVIHTNSSVVDIGARISKYSKIAHVCHIREFGNLDFDMFSINSGTRSYKFLNRYTNAFICVSNAISNHYDMLDSGKKYIIYNGVDRENIIPIHRKGWEIVRFLIAGRISNTKGQNEAINACSLLLEKGIDNFELVIAGSGKESIENHVPQALKSKVCFLGQVNNMPALRSEVDVELVCSRAEAFGRVTAEAMMAGLPVIGSNTGGTPELIVEGETGFLYEYNNLDDLVDKMEILITNSKLRNIMGQKAQNYAIEHFTIDRCVDEIEAVYHQVLKGRDDIENRC